MCDSNKSSSLFLNKKKFYNICQAWVELSMAVVLSMESSKFIVVFSFKRLNYFLNTKMCQGSLTEGEG